MAGRDGEGGGIFFSILKKFINKKKGDGGGGWQLKIKADLCSVLGWLLLACLREGWREGGG